MKIKEAGKKAYDLLLSDRPVWAKILGTAGAVVSAIGGAIAFSNPVTLPVAVVAIAPWAVLVGNFATLYAQGQKRK